MAGLAAFIIPIGTLVAGEGLAALVLERHDNADFREQRWQEVEFTVTYRAIFVRYLQRGLPDRDAKIKAFAEVKGYLGTGTPSAVRSLSAGTGQTGQGADGQANTVKNQVRAYLVANPDVEAQTVRDVVSALQVAGIKAGRTTVSEVLKERKQGS